MVTNFRDDCQLSWKTGPKRPSKNEPVRGRYSPTVPHRDRGEIGEPRKTQPIARTLRGDDFGMVGNAIDYRAGEYLVTEDLTPPGKRKVGRQDQRGELVTRRDQLKEGLATSCS